jgi:hypothetical protein
MSIGDEPHYEIHSTELAAWIEEQGTDRVWRIPDEPLHSMFLLEPHFGDDLAAEFRRLNRALLVLDPTKDPTARGQTIDRTRLDALVRRYSSRIVDWPFERPILANDRYFDFCWKGSDVEWRLVEDIEATEDFRQDALEDQGITDNGAAS